MIRKLQLKFVATTMSILLAVFIAVLGSINLIMQTIMQQQSKTALNQIAKSIRYDEKTSTFSFELSDKNNDFKIEPADSRPDKNIPPGQQSSSSSEPASSTQAESSSTETTTTTVSSETQADAPVYVNPDSENPNEPQQPNSEPSNVDSSSNSQPPDVPINTTENSSPNPQSGNNSQPVQTTAVATPPYEQPVVTTTVEIQAGPPPNGNPNRDPDDEHHDGSKYWWEYDNPPEIPDDEPLDVPREWDEYMDYDYYHPYCYYDYEEYEEPTDVAATSDISQLANDFQIDVLDGYQIIDDTAYVADVNNMQNGERGIAPPKPAATIDFFVFMADQSGNLLDTLNSSDIDTSLAQRYINSILADGATTGMIETLQFYKVEKDNGTILVFTDKSIEMDMLDRLTETTILIGCVSFMFICVLVVFLSKKSIAPVKKAFEKQKQFVSDASHELKTPLTIISANADVLADEIGENKWLTYIKAQIERMSLLVNDLLNLTRLENNSTDIVFTEFNLSQAILNTALPFECQAFEAQKKFEVNVQEGIYITASERHIKQMAAIFIDNAIKHSCANGEIKITLTKQGDKKIFTVFNTGSSIKEEDKEKIFERFYRSDDSRSRSTGGYGLGLAIAKSIIDYHKFKISVSCVDDKSVCFTIIM